MLGSIAITVAALVAAAPPSTEPAEKPVSSDLTAVQAYCSDVALLGYTVHENEQVDPIYQGIAAEMATERSITEEEMLRLLLDETYNEAEQTWTIPGAWAQGDDEDYELTQTALLFGLAYDCALESLEVPERIQSHIGTTRALDGTQEDSWEDYSARWTYHPDDGMNITIWVA